LLLCDVYSGVVNFKTVVFAVYYAAIWLLVRVELSMVDLDIFIA
jgi:hypothetical protein